MCIQPLATWFALTSIIYLMFSSVTFGATINTATQETLKQLELIEKSVNRSADPCDDFYAYACGNWDQHHPYVGQDAMYVILKTQHNVMIPEMFLENYPKNDVKEHNQTFVDKTVSVFYSLRHGENLDYFEVVRPGKNIEWPLINAYDGKEQQNLGGIDVFDFLGRLFSFGFNNVIINRSLRRHANGTLYISLGVPDQFNPAKAGIIHELLSKIGFATNSDKYNQYQKEIQNSYSFWQSTYKNYNEKNEDSMTYDQVKAVHPKLATFLENMLPNEIQKGDIVEITNLKYVEFLVNKQWETVEIQTLCNYLMFEFFRYVTPWSTRFPEKLIMEHMNLAVNFLFYQHYIKPHEQKYNEAFNTLLEQIYKHVQVLVDENNLKFTDNLLQAIKHKLSKVHTTKGNLPDNVDFDMVEEFYRDVPDLSVINLGRNKLYLFKHHLLKTINCPKHMACDGDVGPTTGNIPEDDLMIVPFASFTPPMYHWNFDPLLSVSLMGTLLGHEFTHSMDTSSLTSKDVYETLYEDFKKHPELNNAQECMVEQEFTEDIRERVADFAGARVAYQVYAKEYNVQPTFSTIPWKQLFFLNMAQYFCQAPYAKAIAHDASDVRMRQIAMNMDEFAEAFQCPVGSKMNPEKKCRFY